MINNAVAVKPKILTSIKKFFQFFKIVFEKNAIFKNCNQSSKNNIFLDVYFDFKNFFLKQKNFTKRKFF